MLEESCKGLGSVTLKIKQSTHTLHPRSIVPNAQRHMAYFTVLLPLLACLHPSRAKTMVRTSEFSKLSVREFFDVNGGCRSRVRGTEIRDR